MRLSRKNGFMVTAAAVCALALFFFGCKTLPENEEIELSRNIAGEGRLTAEQLAAYFLSQNPEKDAKDLLRFARYYVDEARAEGINSDVAFAQMCLETGYLRFGNLVTPEMHNYCGLGAIDAAHPGEYFPTEQLGVRAHIQHLQAYATTADSTLHHELIDPRYDWVHRTKYIQNIWELAGTWATDPAYGEKLNAILERMEQFAKQQG